MKNQVLFVLLLLLSVAKVLSAPPQAGEKYEATSTVHVRARPCTNADILRTIVPGTVVKATGGESTACGFTWIQVAEGSNGWIASKFLKRHDAPTPSARGKNVLLIGDSHTCGVFGKTLDQKLRSAFGEQHAATFGRAGMGTNSYLTGSQYTSWGWVDFLPNGKRNWGMDKKVTPKLSSLLSTYKPQITLVALGANEIHNSAATMKAQLNSAMSQITASAGNKCVWIAPPQTRCDAAKCPYSPAKLAAYYSLLAQVASAHHCKVIKSDPATRKYLNYNALINGKTNKGDGIHFDSLGQAGRTVLERWATDVFDELAASMNTLSEVDAMLRGY